MLCCCRKTLKELKRRKYCNSAQWLSFSDSDLCSRGMRVMVEGFSVQGQMRFDRGDPVNFEVERENLFELYAGTSVLRGRFQLEDRILQSLGLDL